MLQLFTDTSANLPVALTKQHHITVVRFSYTVDGKETDYPDDVDFDGAEKCCRLLERVIDANRGNAMPPCSFVFMGSEVNAMGRFKKLLK